MFKYLERILGKPMKYYETLMSSKTENFEVNEIDIKTVLQAIEPHAIPSTVYQINSNSYDSIKLKNSLIVPKNKKKEPIPLFGTFFIGDDILFLFVNEEKVIKDSSNYLLSIEKADQFLEHKSLALNKPEGTIFHTLPIWEEVIHRFPEIHKLIISLNPKNPWTLYKKAVIEYNIIDKNIVLGGYPQWRINNVDYRKIKDLNFLMEYKIDEKNYSIFFFKDPNTHEIISIEQKD